MYTPTTFISWPLKATLRLIGDDGFAVHAKNPSMSVSTGKEREGNLIYLPTGYAKDVTDIFSTGEIADVVDIAGKVVITEGLPMPAKVEEMTNRVRRPQSSLVRASAFMKVFARRFGAPRISIRWISNRASRSWRSIDPKERD